MDTTPWFGVDLDGTLARYGFLNRETIGVPIKPMVTFVQDLLSKGHRVKIISARVSSIHSEEERAANKLAIEAWCETHIGRRLDVTSEINEHLQEFYSDRAIQVEYNEGRLIVEI